MARALLAVQWPGRWRGRWWRLPYFAGVAGLAVLLAAVPGRAGIEEDASAFVEERGLALLEIVGQPRGEERRAAFDVWLTETLALDVVALLALGPYRASASPEELVAYLPAVRRYVVAVYDHRFDAFSGYGFRVLRARGLGEADAQVRARATGPEGGAHIVDFRLRRGEGGFRVLDVAIDGLSMLKTQRDEFAAVIRQNGIAGLTASLDEMARRAADEDSGEDADEAGRD